MTGFLLPSQIPTATGWVLADYRPEVTIRSQPAAGGQAIAYGEQLGSDYLWLIDHAVTSCTSSTDTALRMYADAPTGFLLDGTDAGNFQVADWPAGLQLASGRQLCAVWSGASAGAVGTLGLQVRVLRRIG